MPRRATYVSIGCALVLGACATPGAPVWTPPPAASLDRRLMLDDCIQIALASDVRSAQWRARLEGASAELSTARTPPNPSFGASWEDLGLRDAGAAQAKEEIARRAVIEPISMNWQAYRAADFRYKEYAQRIAADRARLAGDAQDLFAGGQIAYVEVIQARTDWQRAEIAAADSWRESMSAAWEIDCRTRAYAVDDEGGNLGTGARDREH